MYFTIAERMKLSLRRAEAEATGLPLYMSYDKVPEGLYSKTMCKKLRQPITEGELPAAYVLNRYWFGYLPLYKRETKIQSVNQDDIDHD